MTLSQIQEAVNNKTMFVTTVSAGGVASTVKFWVESAADYVPAVTVCYIATMIIINIPKVIKVIISPFKKK